MTRFSHHIEQFPGTYPVTALETTANGMLYVEYAVTPSKAGSVAIGPNQPVQIEFSGLSLTDEQKDAYIKHAAGIWEALTGMPTSTLEYDSATFDFTDSDKSVSVDA